MSDLGVTSEMKVSNKHKVKKKMSKAQMQLAIIKKKQCDARALIIVEQLLEPNVNADWLLQNLRFINRSHMEDVIEERAIVKLCGYVLCNNPLTTVITQQYHISTRRNKVYDVTRRKNFCSSLCYGASSYLLEQMLTSPLWLRDKEEIPVFQLLPLHSESARSTPGDEICVRDVEPVVDSDIDKGDVSKEVPVQKSVRRKEIKTKTISETKIVKNSLELDVLKTLSESHDKETSCTPVHEVKLLDEKETTKEVCTEREEKISEASDANANKSRLDNLDNLSLPSDIIADEITTEKEKHSVNENLVQGDTEDKIIMSNTNTEFQILEQNMNYVDETKVSKIMDQSTEDIANQKEEKIDNKNHNDNNNENTHQITDEQSQITSIHKTNNDKEKKLKRKESVKQKRVKQKDNNESEQSAKFYSLAMRIEQSVKEWITEDTLSLLAGKEDTKHQLLENMMQHDRYQQLCKKLNKLQLEDEKEDRTDRTERDTLKPLPHFSVLKEQGMKMELKVRAFYEGRLTIETPKSTAEQNQSSSEKQDNSNPVLPLIDAHAPKAVRRRIFLDKLNRILPDLLRILSGSSHIHSQYSYNSERSMLIKVLASTFALSATNIVFKSAEWTLVGLVILKMLSVIDPPLRTLLDTKQASMYISMILMSYKLDPKYLDRLIIELTNNPKIFDANCNTSY